MCMPSVLVGGDADWQRQVESGEARKAWLEGLKRRTEQMEQRNRVEGGSKRTKVWSAERRLWLYE